MEEYDQQLQEIRTAIDDSVADVWDAQTEPFTIDLDPFESVSIQDLAKTDDPVFSQILEVFTTLCEEMRELTVQARKSKTVFILFVRRRRHIMRRWLFMVMTHPRRKLSLVR